ncbi:hypothetical protein PTKIN_Ptkin14bG0115300 [Pterospermum kingtungense]
MLNQQNQNVCTTIWRLEGGTEQEVELWSLFVAVKKCRGNDWYGTAAILRRQDGECLVVTRSFMTNNKSMAKLLILREILQRGRERNIKKVQCFEYRREWENLLTSESKVHWTVHPLKQQVTSIIKDLREMVVVRLGHPLSRCSNQLARQAASTRMSFSWPDENLVSPIDGKTIVKTARFLKPFVQTVSQAVTVPNTPLLFEISSENLGEWQEKVDIKGWHVPHKRWKEWVDSMAGKYGALWKLTGICDAIMSSIYKIKRHKDLLLGLVEFWCPETNTFVFPW